MYIIYVINSMSLLYLHFQYAITIRIITYNTNLNFKKTSVYFYNGPKKIPYR